MVVGGGADGGMAVSGTVAATTAGAAAGEGVEPVHLSAEIAWDCTVDPEILYEYFTYSIPHTSGFNSS